MIGTTNSILSSGTTEIDEYFICVVDYDGTIIHLEYSPIGTYYTLPNPPSHTGLVFQGWSCSQNIINNSVTIIDNNIMIGPIYTTSSGQNEFDIELSSSTGLSVTLNIDGTKNWGDGTTNTSTTHTYTNYGSYTIKCNGTQITTSDTSYGMFNQDYDNRNNYVKAVRLATISNIIESSFQCCSLIESITLSRSVTTVDDTAFYRITGKIKAFIIPNSLSVINRAFIMYCESIEYLVIPNSITSIGYNSFSECSKLKYSCIPDSVVEFPPHPSSSTLYSGMFDTNLCMNTLILPNKYVIGNLMVSSMYVLQNLKIGDNINCNLKLQYCHSLKTFTLPNVKNFNILYCYALEYLIFSRLTTFINSQSFRNDHNLKNLDFSNCRQIPELGTRYVFSYINKLFKIIVSWDMYQDWVLTGNWKYFKNNTISYSQATINFSRNSNINIYINNELINSNTIIWYGSKLIYDCHDTTNNIVLPKQQKVGIQKGSTVNIPVSISNYNRITLSTGINGLTVKFYINNIEYTATENNGDYYINVSGSNIDVEYQIDGKYYLSEYGSITTNNTDIIRNITLTSCSDTQDFVRPNLTSDGTLGGNSFAVWQQYQYPNSELYLAFDSDTTGSYSRTRTNNINLRLINNYVIYNPTPLKITQLDIIHHVGNSNIIDITYKIQISDDNIDYEDLDIFESNDITTQNSIYQRTITLNKSRYCKYYKICILIGDNTNSNCILDMYNVGMTGKVKII